MISTFNYSLNQIEQYLNRIKFPGDFRSIEVNLENLSSILSCHVAAIPLGALDLVYYDDDKPSISIAPKDIFQKLVVNKREGHCVEHAILFDNVISRLGYDGFITSARVLDLEKHKNEGLISFQGRSHCINIVKLNNEQYVVDTGFIMGCSRAPLPIYKDDLKSTTHRITQADYGMGFKTFFYEINRFNQPSLPLYTFNLANFTLPDLELLNLYITHSSNSVFLQNLYLTRLTPSGSMVLNNNRFTIKRDNQVITKEISTKLQRRQIFQEYFDIIIADTKEHLPPNTK